uniref:Serine hydrolase domain-containing protein n=1 Tax=Haptolina brevifila TaxID=156173 RepID=A0A7S2FGR5_9EUKA|mmetsp:Transcript_11288/g.22833  ORF Transcript_11288/g.22833 Transcript_11288/m.22833 type:complete len:216 (+) Transcript_11288:237-884(+)
MAASAALPRTRVRGENPSEGNTSTHAVFFVSRFPSAKMPAMLKQIFPGPYYEWWNSRTDTDGAVYYDHLDASLELVCQHVAAHGPFDGILGFSQGGSFAHLLCLLSLRGSLQLPLPPRFGVFISSRASRHHGHRDLVEAVRSSPLALPSLVIYGGKDTDVPPADTRELIETLDPSCLTTVYLPEGTHRVPKLEPANVATVAAFFEQRHMELSSGA